VTPVGDPLRLDHAVLPDRARLWGAGRPAYPDEPPSTAAVEAGVRGWRAMGVEVVVSLLEDRELDRRAPGLFPALDRHGIRLARYPVVDFGAPVDAADFARLLDRVHDHLAAGRGVLAHCNAGLGRTAVFLAALLRYSGFRGDAVAEIRRLYRPDAMREPAQETFVRHFPLPSRIGRRER
jgi:protein-tyrosine phosphatase